jgi:hypothetical protein
MNRPLPSALVVLHSFGIYNKGDLIQDPVAITAILNGGKAAFVIPTILPAEGSPANQEH